MGAEGGRAARRVALHRAAADAEGVGDLGLGEVQVVAQRQHLALALGEGAQRVEDGRPPVGVEGGVGRRPARRGPSYGAPRAAPRRPGAAGPTGSG